MDPARLSYPVSANSAQIVAGVAPAASDEEIIRRVLDGDASLFELIVRRYNQRLFRATKAILKNDAEAEDAMQEAYVRAFIHLDQFTGGAKFSTWLTKIAVHEALGQLRRRKRYQEVPDSMRSRDNPERSASDVEMQGAIEQAVEKLPPSYRSVFVMREIEEMTGPETAECLGVSEETVKTRLHRARRLLRTRLERAVTSAVGRTFSYGEQRCDRMTAAVMSRIHALGEPH